MSPKSDGTPWPEPAASGAKRSTLGADLKVDGQIRSRGPVDVQGTITGSISAPEVVVAASGRVDGSVVGLDVSIVGSVTGTIEAERATLAATAVVEADIRHDRIAIESGARMEGQLKRRS